MSKSPGVRRRLLIGLAAVLLVAVPVFEIWLIIQVGQLIGVLPTIGLLIAEAILGSWLVRREGRRAWRALNEALAARRTPTRELTDGVLVLIGGILLALPGFATDLVGLCCLVPFTRPLPRRLLSAYAARRMDRFAAGGRPSWIRGDGEVIEGEAVDEPSAGRHDEDTRVIKGEIT